MHVYILIFIFSPFLSFLTAISKWYNKVNRIVITLFASFVGYTMVLIGDLERYSVDFLGYERSLNVFFANLFNFNVGKPIVDFYDTILTEFGFSSNLQFALSFSFFCFYCLKNASLLYSALDINKIKGIKYLILSFLLLTLYSLKLYYNLAFFLGGTFYLFCVLSYIVSNDRFYFYLGFVTPLFHLGLLPFLVGLVALRFIKSTNLIYFLVAISLLYSSIGLEVLRNFDSLGIFHGSIFNEKYNAYASEAGLEWSENHYKDRRQNYNDKFLFLISIEELIINVFLPFAFLFLFIIEKAKVLKLNLLQREILNFSLILFALSNFLVNISQGLRFKFFPIYIGMIFFLSVISNIKLSFYKIIFWVYSVVLILFSLMWLVAFIFLSLSINTILFNFPIELFLKFLQS